MRAPLILFPLLATVSAPAGMAMSELPEPGEPVLVIAAPWVDIAGVVHAMGGVLLGPQLAPMAALMATEGDDVTARARAAGAWFVMDGRFVAAICGEG